MGLAALLALGLAVVSAAGAGGATVAADPLAAVQQVLDARVGAVRAGDRGAFLATVDPQAPPAFVAAQARHFDGLRSLPLSSYALRARTEGSGDLGRAAAGRYGGAPVFLPETRQVHRLRGYDDRDAVDTLWLTFVQRQGRWYVGGDSDLEALGLETARQVGDFGPVVVQPTERFLVLSHPGQAERARALAAMAGEAVARLGQAWDQPWSGRVPIVLPGSVEELERVLQATVDMDKFVAFVSYGAVQDDGYETTAPRMYVQDKRLGRYPRSFQVATLAHELSHAAVAPLAGPFVPAWVHEGVADWIAAGRPVGERRPAGGDQRLPRDHEFTTGSGEAIVRAYRESRSAVSALADRAGPGAPTALVRALGEARVEAGSVDYRVDLALRRVAGVGLDELERHWATRS